MTDRNYIRKEVAENIADLQQVLTAYLHISDENVIKTLEKTIFNFTCIVAGYYHDKDVQNNID